MAKRKFSKSELNKISPFTAMFEVQKVAGAFIDVSCWDQNDRQMRNIFTNAAFHEPVLAGDVYMLTLAFEHGGWKVVFASPKYLTEMVTVGLADGEYDDDCPICQELKKEVEGSAQ